jgi:hypothetical protein
VDELGDECPGEAVCARGKFILHALAPLATADGMKKLVRDPPQDVVDATCAKCPLLPTKPGNEDVPPQILTAYNEACSKLEDLDMGFPDVTIDNVGLRTYYAMKGVHRGRQRYESELLKKQRNERNSDSDPVAKRNKVKFNSDDGVMDD